MNILPEHFLINSIQTPKQFKFIHRIFAGSSFDFTTKRDNGIIEHYIKENNNQDVCIEMQYLDQSLKHKLSKTHGKYKHHLFLNYRIVGYSNLSYYQEKFASRHIAAPIIPFSTIYKMYHDHNLITAASIIEWLNEKIGA